MIHYTTCPACGSTSIKPLLSARDHTVSGEQFAIWRCAHCTLAFTQDVPEEDHIGPYYQAESYISHTDTQKGLVNQLYHKVRSYTLRQKYQLILQQSGRNKGRLLDIGAGTGAFAGYMQGKGWDITALEPDPETRKRAAELNQVQAQDTSVLFSLPEQQYDVITLWHVLEHVHDLNGYFKRFRDLLKPDGLLVIAVPNYTSGDANAYGPFWAAWDVPRHLYHFSPQSMETLLKAKGFHLHTVKPMWFDSFYVSLLSEKYKKGAMPLVAGAWAGLRSNLTALSDTRRCSSVIYLSKRY